MHAGRADGQAPERGRLAAIAGGENVALSRRRPGQRVRDGGAGVGDRSQSRIPKSAEGHQRGAPAAGADDHCAEQSTARHTAHAAAAEKACGQPNAAAADGDHTIADTASALKRAPATHDRHHHHSPNNENVYLCAAGSCALTLRPTEIVITR